MLQEAKEIQGNVWARRIRTDSYMAQLSLGQGRNIKLFNGGENLQIVQSWTTTSKEMGYVPARKLGEHLPVCLEGIRWKLSTTQRISWSKSLFCIWVPLKIPVWPLVGVCHQGACNTQSEFHPLCTHSDPTKTNSSFQSASGLRTTPLRC